MSDRYDADADRLPLVWRVPPWQASALILLAAALLGVALYGPFAVMPQVALIVVAVAALSAAALALRLLLVVDTDGIGVRRTLAQFHVPWDEVADIDTVVTRGTTMTVRIRRTDGTSVDVPPTLVQPTLPTNVRRAHAMVGEVAIRLQAIAARQHR